MEGVCAVDSNISRQVMFVQVQSTSQQKNPVIADGDIEVSSSIRSEGRFLR